MCRLQSLLRALLQYVRFWVSLMTASLLATIVCVAVSWEILWADRATRL
jgi:hypothetical protein